MKRVLAGAAGWLAAAAWAAAGWAATVDNLTVEETEASIVIRYDLEAAGPASVRLVGSADGGETYDLKVETVEGDLGPDVPPGAGKRIVWRFPEDHPAGLGGFNVVLQVLAEEAGTEPEAAEFTPEDEALASCLEGRADAACEAGLETLGRRHLWFLLEALDHPRPEARSAVARVLGRLGDREAVAPLIALLEDTPLPEGDNTVTVREKRRIQVQQGRTEEKYQTVRNR